MKIIKFNQSNFSVNRNWLVIILIKKQIDFFMILIKILTLKYDQKFNQNYHTYLLHIILYRRNNRTSRNGPPHGTGH